MLFHVEHMFDKKCNQSGIKFYKFAIIVTESVRHVAHDQSLQELLPLQEQRETVDKVTKVAWKR